jgi:predicted metal-dependent enzyme (double-stranded beta helix superfamily)
VERAVADPAAIDARLGAPSRGGIETLCRSGELTVLWIVWPSRARLFPRDHRMWAANGIFAGREDNTFYRRRRDGIVVSGGSELETGETLLLGADAINGVVNPTAAYTAALNVYGGDYFGTARSQWDPETLREAPFDVEQVRSVLAHADDEARRR